MKLLIAVLLSLFFTVGADDIDDIREYYNHVMNNLDNEFGLYRTEISINTEDGVYPALGNYQENITFYWGSEAGYSWLVLVIWSSEFSVHQEYGEVLFSEPEEPWEGDTGELVFEFVSYHNSDGILSESRWWYEGGELLRSSGQSDYPSGVIEFTPDIPGEYDYAHNPTELLEMFNSIHY
ncbi:MAG: hypothetical protein ABFR50_05380 [Candidatus Fermentibacteria bacterium]